MPKNKIPKIRFEGFSGEWEERKFKEIANVRRGLTYKPSDICSYGIKVLRSSNINEDNFVQNADDVYVREEAINIDFANEFDILITSANGSNRLVGKHAIIQNLNSKAVHGGFMLLATSKNPFFLNASMSSSWYKKFINKFISGGNGAIGNLSKSDLDEQEIPIPSLAEQQKIGDFFQQLDKLIEQKEKKYHKLKQLKIALLAKMFPQNGKTTPEIRFEGFSGEWEERKLGEIGEVRMCKRILKEQTLDIGEIPFYKIGTFGKEPDAYISRELFNEYKSKYSYPNIGDVLISASGTIGKLVIFDGRDAYFQDSNIVWIENNEKQVLNKYLFYSYQVAKWEIPEGGTIQRLYNENLKKTQILFPSLAEQQKIGDFFQQLDKLIELQQQEIKKLKNIKKAFLSKMFV
ncbi:restriction endonuclease subunit S [Helicobacter sp. 11S02596-1]|uniref:restriction endonuclease subunit S n=1 Tax=Helicobacter sp. 11S02596-1 TaxID=1476194 RepID=UPI000BD3205B|nr:restriction endonuclease subunit S [Helicobacter sp. 11S02596-1]PAF41919.1 hypothetical protein BJI48_07630 [Helicobacter sp. 11S02596-1]